jgi:virginiamycin B lyase
MGSAAFGQSAPTIAEYQIPTVSSEPLGITGGPDNAVWFTEGFGNKVGRIVSNGTITEFPIPTFNAGLGNITPGPDGALWFVEGRANKIGRITTTGAVTEFSIPTSNSGATGVTAGPDGALWFTEQLGNKIGRVSTAGTFTEFTIPVANASPQGITSGPDGALWFGISNGSQLVRISTAGVFSQFPASIQGSPAFPFNLTTGPDGALWFSEDNGLSAVGGSFIGRMTTAGAFTNFPTPTVNSVPVGIVTGPDGALWFTEATASKIGRITTAGIFIEYPTPTPQSEPYSIALGPDGALWFTEPSTGKIGQVTVPRPPSLTISAISLPDGSIGPAYSATLTATGGTPPYGNWLVSSGALPPGLMLDTVAGVISGGPSSLGTFNFSVTVQDSTGATSAPQSFSIVIGVTPVCSFALDAGGRIFSAAGGFGTIAVTTDSTCAWSVSGVPAWVTITSGASGMGSSSVTYTVSPNNVTSALTATLTIAGQPFTIQEAAAIPDLIPGIPQQLSFIGSMPHMAAEGDWNTTFTFVNKGSASAVARTSLFGIGGSPLVVPVNLPQQAPPLSPLQQSLETSSLDKSMAPNASFVLEAFGPPNVPFVEGSAQLASTGTVDGFAIFHYDPSSQEAVVPLETRNAASYVLAFDNTGAVLTGVALANLSPLSTNVPVILRNDAGVQIGSGSIALFGSGHTSFVLSTQFPVTVNIRGTVEFDSPVAGPALPGFPTTFTQISVIGIRYTPPGTLTTIPALANVGTTGGSFAHIASGNGWQTTFVLVNTGNATAQANLQLFDDNGNVLPLSVTFPQTGTASPFSGVPTQTIPAHAMVLVESAGPLGSPLLTGSAQLTTTGSVSAYAIYRYNPSGQEAVVPLETRNASTYLLAFDNTGGTTTGLAISDVSAPSATKLAIPAILRDDAGNQLAATSIPISANGHSSQSLTTFFPAAAGIRGTVEFDAPAGVQISVLGIRSPPALTFTTLPALAK